MAGIEVGGVGRAFNPQAFVGSDAYKFLGDQGRQQIERRAGAAGTLLTGGTLKDLTQFGQGLASTFWGQQMDNDYRYDALNADISAGNANRTLGGLTSLAGYGLGAANGMAGAYGNYGQAGAMGTYGQANAINSGVGAVGNSLADFFARRKQAAATGGAATGVPDPNQGLW